MVFLAEVKNLSRTGVRASARAGAAEILPKKTKAIAKRLYISTLNERF